MPTTIQIEDRDDASSMADEEVSQEFLQMLFEAWEAKEKKKKREKLVQPHWLKDPDPAKPKTDAPDPE